LIQASTWLKDTFNNPYTINMIIGVLSAIIDNVPLVAASMGMYPIAEATQDPWLQHFVQDGVFWEFLAYCAGTGGSILIIGSAAGVAVMGLEKITFSWYLKKISPWALLGYLSGGVFYILMHA
jgi:Na+/H+ antiporter NhaD/arsenite permease-like protein